MKVSYNPKKDTRTQIKKKIILQTIEVYIDSKETTCLTESEDYHNFYYYCN